MTETTKEMILMEESYVREPYGGEVVPEVEVPEVMEGQAIMEESPTTFSYDEVYSAVYDAVMAANLVETVTDGQTVNSTALNYFEGIIGNQKLPVDYVVYTGAPYTYNTNGYERTAYEYCMMYGDLSLEGITFTGEDVKVVRMRTNGEVSVNYETAEFMSVTAPMYYSRSNLGQYSGIINYDWDGVVMLVYAVLGGIIWYMSKIMCLRR